MKIRCSDKMEQLERQSIGFNAFNAAGTDFKIYSQSYKIKNSK